MTSRSYLEQPVKVDMAKPLRASADSMRAYTKATGRTLSETLQGEDDADRFQCLAFFELYGRAAKAGHLPDAGELYDAAGKVEIEIAAPEDAYADPLGAASSKTSPPSAGTGA